MDRRQSQRLPKTVPVRISGTDAEGKSFEQLAHTVDISNGGVRVDGIHLALRVGTVVSLEHDDEMRFYRVVWIGKIGTSTAGQIGLQALDPGNWIWDLSGFSSGAIC